MGLSRSFSAGRGTSIRSAPAGLPGRYNRRVWSLTITQKVESHKIPTFAMPIRSTMSIFSSTSNKFANHWSRSHSPSPLSTAESVKVGQIITPSAYISSPTRMILPKAIMICDIAKMKREIDLNRAVGFVLARDCGSRIMGCGRKVVRSFGLLLARSISSLPWNWML